MRKFIIWTAITLAVWAALYGAFVLQIEGALYIIKFYVWATLPLACLSLHPKIIEAAAKEPPTPIRDALSTVKSWVVLGCLVWFGHIFTAVAWAICMVITFVFHHGIEKERSEEVEAA